MRCPELRRALERSADRLINDYANASGAAANDDCDPACFATWVTQVVTDAQDADERADAAAGLAQQIPDPAPVMTAAPLALRLVADWPAAHAEEAAAWELIFLQADLANRPGKA